MWSLDGDDIESLRARTGGWAGGLRLAALALAENADPDAFVENVVRTEALISDYLVQRGAQQPAAGDAAVPAPNVHRAGTDTGASLTNFREIPTPTRVSRNSNAAVFS